MSTEQRWKAIQGLHELRMYDEAWNEFEQLPPEERASPAAIGWELLLHIGRGRTVYALGRGIKEIELHPEEASIRFQTALAAELLGQKQVALDILNSGEHLMRGAKAFHFARARNLCKVGKSSEARFDLSIVLESEPSLRRELVAAEDLRPLWPWLRSE